MNLVKYLCMRVEGLLKRIGSAINSTPEEVGKVSYQKDPLFLRRKEELMKKLKKRASIKVVKSPKGSPNTDARTFNHPRKDVH